ncbi:SRPBCC family protein [uncultured Sphingomonas sp.]|uniref:SRPBCC family protein n=1 Tax=uncultured Sphingomonas sp. TaxID=158754 RepID=UPI0035CC6500
MQDVKELSVERHIAAKPDIVWRVMTERMADWWCPRPWTTEIVEQDWRPGGRAAMVMRGPDGEEFPQEGVFLEVMPGRRFITTDAYAVGWSPREPFMTGVWEIEPEADGTRYRASARHWTAESVEKHRAMGFEQGWSAVADQLKALCEGEAK